MTNSNDQATLSKIKDQGFFLGKKNRIPGTTRSRVRQLLYSSQKENSKNWEGKVTHRYFEDDILIESPLDFVDRHNKIFFSTMRTPGDDFELAAGVLVGEMGLSPAAQLPSMRMAGPLLNGAHRYMHIDWQSDASTPSRTRQKPNSSCGYCGLADWHWPEVNPASTQWNLSITHVCQAQAMISTQQHLYKLTGSCHAAALFCKDGSCLVIREDVGRHNAVDKVIGWAILCSYSVKESWLWVSSRCGYEIVEKAARAGIPALCAVSAPTSLAIQAAKHFNITLIGFAREGRFNLYHQGCVNII